MPTMDKINVNLDLTEQQAGYLISAVVDFYHKLGSASSLIHLEDESLRKMKLVKEIWLMLEEQTGIA